MKSNNSVLLSRNTLRRVFYVYSEASVAVFMFSMGLVELACYFGAPDFFKPIAFGAFVVFTLIAIGQGLYVYIDAKKSGLLPNPRVIATYFGRST